jgi:hypothetical protein
MVDLHGMAFSISLGIYRHLSGFSELKIHNIYYDVRPMRLRLFFGIAYSSFLILQSLHVAKDSACVVSEPIQEEIPRY